jgi:hypothetical protein
MATAVWQNVLAARIPAALIQVFQLRIQQFLSGGFATGHELCLAATLADERSDETR